MRTYLLLATLLLSPKHLEFKKSLGVVMKKPTSATLIVPSTWHTNYYVFQYPSGWNFYKWTVQSSTNLLTGQWKDEVSNVDPSIDLQITNYYKPPVYWRMHGSK